MRTIGRMERTPSLPNAVDRGASIKAEHRRLAILRFLEAQPGYRGNERVVGDYLHEFALSGSRAEVRACFDFLERSGLVANRIVEDVLVSALTPAGLEFLEGRSLADGVRRPLPE